ncbi:hypothetical protein C8R45DRAFT_902713 [Mycena sanguinolenta]|nr:hypothetical protein C8R45DRAFT_902713 [Mycena sanguinolenta]
MASESSSSQTFMSSLDPSDPLNLWLHNNDGPDTDTDSATTPPDWNLSSMWPPVEDQKMDFDMGFGLVDMTFDPAAGIEPNALINYPYATPEPFPFTFESPHLSSRSSSDSGSTSGSFSPRASYSPPASEFEEDPATELATRALKAAGVVHAVPINQEQQRILQQQKQQQQQQQQQVQQRHPDPPSYSSPPPAFTTTPVPPPALANTLVAPPPSRPKTSHTTIERRYRTNLNARIQSLRQAVPALRVVDRAAAIKAGEPPVDADTEDIVDARGFVDGVKVARKCSKANVLGKAVEYIRVLKNRETRLSRELAGLKTLLNGLVGGRELLEEWEREWTARFGGPETDEVSESGAPADAEADEGDDDDDDSDEEGARKRKKPKVDAKPKPERKPAAPPVEGGEKKKRGRPRKVVALPPTALAPALSTSVPMQAAPQDATQRQYLLGAFALFSFFANANVSVVPPQAHHAHEGHVLSHAVPVSAPSLGLVQIFHLLVSIAVLASVLLPVGRSLYSYARGNFTSKATAVAVPAEKQEVPPPTPTSEEDESSDGDTDLSRSTASISGDDEPTTPTFVCSASASAQLAAAAAAEACILDGATTLPTRLRTALKLYSATPSSPAHAEDARRLLALLVQPVPLVGARVAAQLWGAGSGMGIQVDEAARRLSESQSRALRKTEVGSKGVLRALEETLALERMRGVAAGAFAKEVLEDEAVAESVESEQVLAGARKLGGRVGVLATQVARVLGGGDFDLNVNGEDSEEDGSTEDDVEKLLRAIVLHRRVFVSPSAVSLDDTQAHALRRTLGSSAVFEDGARVEEARDRVVDLLTGQGER